MQIILPFQQNINRFIIHLKQLIDICNFIWLMDSIRCKKPFAAPQGEPWCWKPATEWMQRPQTVCIIFLQTQGKRSFRKVNRPVIYSLHIFLEDFLALYFCQSRLKINMSKDNNRAIKKLQSMIRLELLKMSSIFQSSGFVNRENWQRFLGWIFIYFKWLRYIKSL